MVRWRSSRVVSDSTEHWRVWCSVVSPSCSILDTKQVLNVMGIMSLGYKWREVEVTIMLDSSIQDAVVKLPSCPLSFFKFKIFYFLLNGINPFTANVITSLAVLRKRIPNLEEIIPSVRTDFLTELIFECHTLTWFHVRVSLF